MSESSRRIVGYLAIAFGVMVAYAAVYQFGMATFEGQSITFIQAMHVVVETFTTTGYGEMAGAWDSTEMLVLSMVMQITGVGLIFMTLPVFVVPLVEETLSTTPPTSFDGEGHVVICTFTPRGEVLVEELESIGRSYVVLESDRERARELHGDGYQVVHGDPESVEDLSAASVEDAVALVADDDDETNASIILSARQAAPGCRIVSIIEDEEVADYHRYAGADRVVSPRRLLGESLASKATTSISSQLEDAVLIDDDFEIAELLVQRGSPVEDMTIAESGIGGLQGVNIIGAWFRGEFVSPPDPEAVIDEHTILLVAGPDEKLEALKELTLSEKREHRRGTVVIGGYGVVGSTVTEQVVGADVRTVVVDVEDDPTVDVVGDVTDRETLEAANIHDARSVVLALSDDTTTIFATLVIKQVAPDVEIIARANQTESVQKLYRAGAEYVLALSTVSGRMLASNLLDEEVITPNTQVELVRTEAPELVGKTVAEADIRARTSCTVIAVERGDELLTEVGPDFRIQSGDSLLLCGNDEAINAFNELATG